MKRQEYVIEAFVFRMIVRAVGGLVLLAGVCYVMDFAVWRTRMAVSHDGRGALGSVQVNYVVGAGVKGNKEDYYFDGTAAVDCSESVFPQGGVNACWWQRRHLDVVTRY